MKSFNLLILISIAILAIFTNSVKADVTQTITKYEIKTVTADCISKSKTTTASSKKAKNTVTTVSTTYYTTTRTETAAATACPTSQVVKGTSHCGKYDSKSAFNTCESFLEYANCVSSPTLKQCHINVCTGGTNKLGLEHCQIWWEAAIRPLGGNYAPGL